MQFESFNSILYSDTLVPDIFITDYLPSMDGDLVKIYLHCLFLSKYNKYANLQEISKKLDIDYEKVTIAIEHLRDLEILEVNKKSIILVDLKEKEIQKVYRYKTTSLPAEAAANYEGNKKRNEILEIISKEFFHGMMPPGWYYDIDMWFERYKFDEDVMYSLLKYCYSHNGFKKAYITKVADAWCQNKIITYSDLENYFMEYEKTRSICKKIVTKMKLGRALTEYEEVYVNKWITQFEYSFEIIELALKKTIKTSNPNIKYIDAILTSWNENDLRTKEQIIEFDVNYANSKNSNSSKNSSNKSSSYNKGLSSKDNFDQREYDDDFLESLYKNI